MTKSYVPYDEDTELAILSTYIIFDDVRKFLENEVKPSDFFVPRLATLWGYILIYINKDITTFNYIPFRHFLKNNQDKQVRVHNLDDEDFWSSLLDMVSTSAGIESLVLHLKDLSKRRELIKKCQGIIEICQSKFDGAEIGDLIKDFDIVMESSKKRNLSQEIMQWIDGTEGWWTVTNCDRELQIVTQKEKQNRRTIISRILKAQQIQRDENREGFYRKVDADCDEINILDASVRPLHIQWVFGLQQYVNTYPKTISIVSGSFNAGKTALMLNMAYMNRNIFDIHYFSSEMDATELRSRISRFENCNMGEFKNIHFWDRARNFADVIRPDAMNIIDYFEIDDNFFRINKQLADIRNRLNNGIAIVALQKDQNKALGRGGTFSAEKARLYLTVDPDNPGAKLKIVKGKNWALDNVNPNGLMMKFKLFKGINLIPQGTWMQE